MDLAPPDLHPDHADLWNQLAGPIPTLLFGVPLLGLLLGARITGLRLPSATAITAAGLLTAPFALGLTAASLSGFAAFPLLLASVLGFALGELFLVATLARIATGDDRWTPLRTGVHLAFLGAASRLPLSATWTEIPRTGLALAAAVTLLVADLAVVLLGRTCRLRSS